MLLQIRGGGEWREVGIQMFPVYTFHLPHTCDHFLGHHLASYAVFYLIMHQSMSFFQAPTVGVVVAPHILAIFCLATIRLNVTHVFSLLFRSVDSQIFNKHLLISSSNLDPRAFSMQRCTPLQNPSMCAHSHIICRKVPS